MFSREGSLFERKDATTATRTANSEFLKSLPFMDKRDFEDAKRGLIASLPDGGVIKDAKGRVVWDLTRFSFIKEGAPPPDTMHPSL